MKKMMMLTGLVALMGAAIAVTGCESMCPMKGCKDKPMMEKSACCGCGATTKADCKCPGGACAAQQM